jgi:ribosomal protein S18
MGIGYTLKWEEEKNQNIQEAQNNQLRAIVYKNRPYLRNFVSDPLQIGPF